MGTRLPMPGMKGMNAPLQRRAPRGGLYFVTCARSHQLRTSRAGAALVLCSKRHMRPPPGLGMP